MFSRGFSSLVILRLAMICTVCMTSLIVTQTSEAATFTYQGMLKTGGAPLNGTVDLRFRLYAAAVPPAVPLGNIPINGVVVTDGLINVDLDFGSTAFNGSDRWLEIDVASPANGGSGPFTTLAPRQRITFAPMAQYALNATLSGSYANAVTFGNTANAFSGSGAGLTNLNPASIAAGTIGSALTLSNVSNSFSGNGSGLSNLNAFNIGSGNLQVARLPQSGQWVINDLLRIDNSSLSIDPFTHRVGIGVVVPTHTLDVNGSMSVDGTTLNVDDNLNRVGIGTSTPAAALHVVGTTRLAGATTLTSVPEIPLTTRYAAIPAAGFDASSTDMPYSKTNGIHGVDNGVIFAIYAPVHVPHGATITTVTVFFIDDSIDEELIAYVYKMTLSTGESTLLGQAQSLLTSANVRTVTVPLSHVTDNSTEVLYLRVRWVVPTPNHIISVKGARVTYTIDEPLP